VADVFMHALLADLGPAICVLTSERATELLAACRWRLAVIDVMLPRRSGVEVAERAVAMGTPALLVTGDFRATAKLRRYGCNVLQKPMAMDVLVAEARMAIAQAEFVCHAFQRAAARMRENAGRCAADIPRPGSPAGSACRRHGERLPLAKAERSTGAHPASRPPDPVPGATPFLGRRAAPRTNRS